MANIGKAGTSHKADVTGSKYGDIHVLISAL
jgi:hypothetical protein